MFQQHSGNFRCSLRCFTAAIIFLSSNLTILQSFKNPPPPQKKKENRNFYIFKSSHFQQFTHTRLFKFRSSKIQRKDSPKQKVILLCVMLNSISKQHNLNFRAPHKINLHLEQYLNTFNLHL